MHCVLCTFLHEHLYHSDYNIIIVCECPCLYRGPTFFTTLCQLHLTESSTITFIGSTNEMLISQNKAWLTATLVVSVFIVVVQFALLPATTHFIFKKGKLQVTYILKTRLNSFVCGVDMHYILPIDTIRDRKASSMLALGMMLNNNKQELITTSVIRCDKFLLIVNQPQTGWYHFT